MLGNVRFLYKTVLDHEWSTIEIPRFHEPIKISSNFTILLTEYLRGVITTKASKAAASDNFWDYKKLTVIASAEQFEKLRPQTESRKVDFGH